jgi:putative tryptophan/tyrosine transport system substrate-binding protein
LGIGAIVVGAGVIVGGKSEEILSLAARFALPVMFASSRGAWAGALLTEPTSLRAIANWGYIRILKGENPADLPVIQSTKFEFVINLKTTTALGEPWCSINLASRSRAGRHFDDLIVPD